MTGILDIDHLMLGVTDPGAADFSRLGFTSAPLRAMPQIGLANSVHAADAGAGPARVGTGFVRRDMRKQ